MHGCLSDDVLMCFTVSLLLFLSKQETMKLIIQNYTSAHVNLTRLLVALKRLKLLDDDELLDELPELLLELPRELLLP